MHHKYIYFSFFKYMLLVTLGGKNIPPALPSAGCSSTGPLSIQSLLGVTGRWQQIPTSEDICVTQGVLATTVCVSNYRVIKPQASSSAVEANYYL